MAGQSSNSALSFLKWAGSKRRLLPQLLALAPAEFGKYYEPFLGGGSMFFALAPSRAELSDQSPALIDTYKALKADVYKVIDFLEPLRPSREEFERVKSQILRNRFNLAGRFIYLNKTCWNGLYRVNASGRFNVPFGMPRSEFIFDQVHLKACSSLLRQRSVSIRWQDFGAIEKRVEASDFVFFDPPYVTGHNFNGFADWNEKLFSWDDQLRLALLAKRLVERGVNVMVTNADHPAVAALYGGFHFKQLQRFSTLASNSAKRRMTTEAVFFAGPSYNILNYKENKAGNTNHGSQCRAN